MAETDSQPFAENEQVKELLHMKVQLINVNR